MIADGNALPELLELGRRELLAEVRLARPGRSAGASTSRSRDSTASGALRAPPRLRFCASSMTSRTRRPARRWSTRYCARSRRSSGLLRPAGSRPKSIMIVSSSSRGSSIVFTIRPTVVSRVQTPQQRLQQRRLARADLPRDGDEPGVALEPVAQIVQRFAVHAAGVEVIRIGTQRERTFAQIVEAFVHLRGLLPPLVPATRRACPDRSR